MIVFKVIAPVFLAAILLCGHPAHADGPGAKNDGVTLKSGEYLRQPRSSRSLTGVFAPDKGGEWRTISNAYETTDSDCLGELITPLCAIDTWFACAVRGDRKLCEAVDRVWLLAGGTPYEINPRSAEQYHVYAVWRATEQSIKDLQIRYPDSQIVEVKPGDLLVDIDHRHCLLSEDGTLEDCDTPTGVLKTEVFRETGKDVLYVRGYSLQYN